MSHRPIEQKKIAKLKRSLHVNRNPYIDLTEYLVDRRYASSRKKAEDMLIAGKVRVESHIVGRVLLGEDWVASPLLAAHHRNSIMVLNA